MIHYVECAIDYCQYGDMHERYYVSLGSVSDKALKIMKEFHPQKI